LRIFFVVLARDASFINDKIKELNKLNFPYIIVCGEPVDLPNVVYRSPIGKYDAINFGLGLVPKNTDVVVLNDVDTEIHGFDHALDIFRNKTVSLVYAKVGVKLGPQTLFYGLLDELRSRIPIAASGELMVLRYDILRRILPLKKCKSEDSYIMFKIMEQGGRIAFSESCWVYTIRTTNAKQEEVYKRRTTGGIYQAISMAKPPIIVRMFYLFLPFFSPMLLFAGKKGYYWSRGIILGYIDYIRGDRSGAWKPSY
jgi:hypothetical protein